MLMRVFVLSICVVCICNALKAADECTTNALVAIRAALPSTGSVHAVYVAKEGFGEILIGFDASSGAWYRIDSYACRGRDSAGQGFSGPPRRGMVKEIDAAHPGSDEPLDGFLPIALARDLLARPETIVGCTRRDDGGYRLVLGYKGGSRDPRTAPLDRNEIRNKWIDVSPDGIITAFAPNRETELDDPGRRWQYRETGPVGMRLLETPKSSQMRLASFSFSETAKPESFSIPVVEAMAAQSVVTVSAQLSVAASEINNTVDESSGSRSQLPLLAVGITCVVIGVVAIVFRSRRKAA